MNYPIGVYMCPDAPQPGLHFAPPIVPIVVPHVFIRAFVPDLAELAVNVDLAALALAGITGIKALQLLAACDWQLDRALLVLREVKTADVDPIKLARGDA